MNSRLPKMGMLMLLIAMVGVLAGFDGCNQNGTATVNFEQIGACNGYLDGGSLVSAGPNAAFVLFKVHDLDNRQGKVNFNFDPARMFVNSSTPRAYMSSTLSLATTLGVFRLIATNVPQSQDTGLDGYAVTTVSTANANGAVEANNTSYFLSYETQATDPGVVLSKKDPSRTSWPLTENCLALH